MLSSGDAFSYVTRCLVPITGTVLFHLFCGGDAPRDPSLCRACQRLNVQDELVNPSADAIDSFEGVVQYAHREGNRSVPRGNLFFVLSDLTT